MKILFLLLVSLLISLPAAATPVTDLQVGYSFESQTLFISGVHPSGQDKHFIQRVVVIKNTQDRQEFYFSHQTKADRFIAELQLKANAGDLLEVELYCSQGGLTKGLTKVAASIEAIKKANEEASIPKESSKTDND